jgi:hypothetical protein
VIDIDAESKSGLRLGYNLAENQSVSNDGQMLARPANFPRKKLKAGAFAPFAVQLPPIFTP